MPFAGPKEVPEGAKSLYHEERDAILARPPPLALPSAYTSVFVQGPCHYHWSRLGPHGMRPQGDRT